MYYEHVDLKVGPYFVDNACLYLLYIIYIYRPIVTSAWWTVYVVKDGIKGESKRRGGDGIFPVRRCKNR